MTIDHGLFIQGEGTSLLGSLRLVRSSIGDRLDVGDGVTVEADTESRSFFADRLTVARDLVVQGGGTRITGELRLVSATIYGHLAIRKDPTLSGDLNISGADVATLELRSGRIAGLVDLSNATVQRLDDTPRAWEQVQGGWRLSGLTLRALSGRLHGDGIWTPEERATWLRKDGTRSRRPFTQVAQIYRQEGHPRIARRIAVAGESATSGVWRRLTLGTTIGYGYEPWRAAFVAAILVMLAWSATLALGGDGLFVATQANEEVGCPQDYPCLNRFIYVLETVIPVVPMGQRAAWRLNVVDPHGKRVQAVEYMLDVLGWILALLVIAGVTGMVRRP